MVAKKPRITGMPNGRPRIVITKEQLEKLYECYRDWYKVAEKLGVSTMTVYRRLSEYGIKKKDPFYRTMGYIKK